MAQIELDQEIVDFLRANEALTGETASEFIRRLIRKRQPRKRDTLEQSNPQTALSKFLRILSEIHSQDRDRFSLITKVRGRSRVYFSQNPKEIEGSGRSTLPIEIPGTGWWVSSNTSTQHKLSILEQVFVILNCPSDDRRRWREEFSGSEGQEEAVQPESEEDDPFRI